MGDWSKEVLSDALFAHLEGWKPELGVWQKVLFIVVGSAAYSSFLTLFIIGVFASMVFGGWGAFSMHLFSRELFLRITYYLHCWMGSFGCGFFEAWVFASLRFYCSCADARDGSFFGRSVFFFVCCFFRGPGFLRCGIPDAYFGLCRKSLSGIAYY